jgi:hypothetical protein
MSQSNVDKERKRIEDYEAKRQEEIKEQRKEQRKEEMRQLKMKKGRRGAERFVVDKEHQRQLHRGPRRG